MYLFIDVWYNYKKVTYNGVEKKINALRIQLYGQCSGMSKIVETFRKKQEKYTGLTWQTGRAAVTER